MDVMNSSLFPFPPSSDFEIGPQGAPFPQVPNPPWQTPPDSVHPQAPESSTSANHPAHLSHKDHPGCPTSFDCLPLTSEKPSYSLPILIRAAILGSPMQRLVTRDIYAAVEERFPYFKTAKENWKGSIRHNLSVNKMFTQARRPMIEPGPGAYWTVNMSITLNKSASTRRKQPFRALTLSGDMVTSLPRNEEAPVPGSSAAVARTDEHVPSIPAQGRGHGRGGSRAVSLMPTRSVPARTASFKIRNYAELAGEDEDDKLDDYMPKDAEAEDELVSMARGNGKVTGRKRGRPRKRDRASPAYLPSPPGTPSEEAMIDALIAELAELQHQHGIVAELSMRLADELTDLHADNARARAGIKQAIDKAAHERRAKRTAERRLEQLQRRIADLGERGRVIESGGILQEGSTDGTDPVKNDADIINQALSSEPLVMSGDDFVVESAG